MDLVRQLRASARAYIDRTRDWSKLHKIDESEHQLDSSTLKEIDDFAKTIVLRGDQLIETVAPLFEKLTKASNDELNRAVALLAERENVDPRRARATIDTFIGVTGNVRPESVRYDYDGAIAEGSRAASVENFAALRETNEWNAIDDALVQALNVRKTIDLRNLLSLSDYQLELLRQYLTKERITLFDLLFNPSVTVEYSEQLVRALAARETGLAELTDFFVWVGERSLVLRQRANISDTILADKIKSNRVILDELDALYHETVNRERKSKETYNELKTQRKQLYERLKTIERSTDELKKSSKFLGDSQRIAEYYAKLESRYITNLVDHLNDIKSTELRTERDLAPIKQLGFQTDQIQQLNDDYREYRIVLFNYLRKLLPTYRD